MKRSLQFTILFALGLTFLAIGNGSAYQLHSGDDLYLSEDYQEDLYLFAGSVNFDGVLSGDIVSVGQTTTFDGEIDGNINAAAKRVSVSGQVSRSVRVAGQFVNISSLINGDLTIVAQEATISSETSVNRDLVVIAEEIELNGTITGDVLIKSGRVRISGKISGDVDIEANKVSITPSAVIKGDLVYKSHKKARISPEAQILGETKWKRTRRSTGGDIDIDMPGMNILWSFFFLCGSLIIGAIIIFFKRNLVNSIIDDMKKNALIHGLIGLVVIFLLPLVLFLFAITIIGIPVALAGLSLYGLLLLIGKVFVGIFIGTLILPKRGKTGKVSLGWSLVLGMVILAAGFKMPYLGWLVYFLAWAIGAGALVMAFFRRRQPEAAVEVVNSPMHGK